MSHIRTGGFPLGPFPLRGSLEVKDRLHPKYVDEVKVQVQKIRVPIEESLTVTRGYEASLGIAAKKGRFRNVQKKLDWRFVVSKKADALRRTIEGDMMILNSIQTRLIL